ncbi:MAG: hypothetical protein AB7F41_10640 [Methylocystis sp.]|uniref:hypothetical protein n=1 Tax=Methylocystis sp. TaxID=1911079 RepID=UPI003D0A32EC
MIKAVEGMDRKAAIGVLARAALSLGYVNRPSYVLAGEETVRENIIEEVRHRLGIAEDDNSPDSIEKLAEVLDEESDRLLAPHDTQSALERLAVRGDLPSDLYKINIIPNVVDLYGRQFPLEKEVIETTIRSPSIEQHYGLPTAPGVPALISLFLKLFRTRWPLRDFVMLVAAQRDQFQLHVHQAWRIYPSRVNTAGLKEPVDWLRRFSEVYGKDIEIDGEKGRFFLFLNNKVPEKVHLRPKGGKETIMVSRFTQNDPLSGKEQAALIVAIDVNKYMSTVKDLAVKRQDFIDGFVPEPTRALEGAEGVKER